MPKTRIFSYMLLIVAFVSTPCFSMVFDNRFFPLFERPYFSVEGTRSSFAVDVMFATASKAFDARQNEIGLPELHGPFDQAELARAFVAAGCPNPLRSEWQGAGSIPWKLEGRRQMQGIAFTWRQSIIDWLWVGFSWAFMRVNSRHEFFRVREANFILGPGDELELDQARRTMFSDLGLCEGNTAQLGFCDIDAYLRFGNVWEYLLKFRKIDAGVSLGLLVPTGVTREVGRPASVPFGGDGHWGVYGEADALFELREDLKTGFLVRVSKRFSRTTNRRMPAASEPHIFGVICGQAKVNPGVTIVFSPFILLENLRQGFGIGVYYTLTSHQKDSWTDMRKNKTVPVKLENVERLSKWASDYFTLNIFYDFGKVKILREFDPIVSFRWDVPTNFFVASRVSKTHKVSLGIEFAF